MNSIRNPLTPAGRSEGDFLFVAGTAAVAIATVAVTAALVIFLIFDHFPDYQSNNGNQNNQHKDGGTVQRRTSVLFLRNSWNSMPASRTKATTVQTLKGATPAIRPPI